MDLLFYFFSSLALFSGVMVIQSKNPVHSVLFLILVFFNAAGLLIMVGLDFFAMIFLVVYVGAIAVLFLFVVMMLNIKYSEINEKKLRYLPVGGLICILFLFEIFLIINNDLVKYNVINENLLNYAIKNKSIIFNFNDKFYTNELYTSFNDYSYILDSISNIQAVGMLIYTYYFYYFILCSLILLVAMIGSIVLTMHKNVQVKTQKVFTQNTREFGKTVKKFY